LRAWWAQSPGPANREYRSVLRVELGPAPERGGHDTAELLPGNPWLLAEELYVVHGSDDSMKF
jgi:hypothetical protein